MHTVDRHACLFSFYQVFVIKTSCSHDGFAQLGQGNFFCTSAFLFLSSGQSGKATSFLGPVLLVLVVVLVLLLLLLLLLLLVLLVVVVVALS